MEKGKLVPIGPYEGRDYEADQREKE